MSSKRGRPVDSIQPNLKKGKSSKDIDEPRASQSPKNGQDIPEEGKKPKSSSLSWRANGYPAVEGLGYSKLPEPAPSTVTIPHYAVQYDLFQCSSSFESPTGSSERDRFIIKKGAKEDLDNSIKDYNYSSPSDDDEIEAAYDKQHRRNEARLERRDLVFELTQEKARRMAQAVKVPKEAQMGEGEKSLYLELALRGCKPVMFHHWRTDFATLPESLFTADDTSDEEIANLKFKSRARSEFHAIKAMKDILSLGCQIRDCQVLDVYPPNVVRKAILKFLRWAIDDGGLKTTCETIPVYIIQVQKPNEAALKTVTKLVDRLISHAARHQVAYGEPDEPYWPTLIGFVLCGPIATILSLDSDPYSPAWKAAPDSRVKFMGQFNLTEPGQDVWNSLALAISLIHVRETMVQLATTYPQNPKTPSFRDQMGELDDEDN
ncbi:hypothetical protein N7532_005462 [Penicillium argentinense]|uniref:Uncharacterized protein n=1 Tax=Penicillium argentinense TaxID=1131581 RepID=A0A9W9KAE7_9EURO|nr:uncharacterized protein N7532_005462 [Penicillium argentinense]KAJ5098461.1 hypothetical protein N7532_005462 [Penicillium argentinense]